MERHAPRKAQLRIARVCGESDSEGLRVDGRAVLVVFLAAERASLSFLQGSCRCMCKSSGVYDETCGVQACGLRRALATGGPLQGQKW